MSIENKLTYLDGTKQALKESINNLGGDITSETTFREYAQELDNIYDNLPKTTGEDTSLSLTTLKGKMNIIPKGNTQQDTTQGNQLLDVANLVNSGTSTTHTFTNDILTITNTSGTYNNAQAELVNLIKANPNKILKFTYSAINVTNAKTNSNESNVIQIKVVNGGSTTYNALIRKDLVNLTYTIPSDTSNITSALLTISSNNTNTSQAGEIIVTKPMLQFGDTIKEYEQYTGGTASPNPTFPQPIEVVTGEQEVKVENVNLLANGVAFTKSTAGWYDQLGNETTTLAQVQANTNYYDLKGGTTYTLKVHNYTNINRCQIIYVLNGSLSAFTTISTLSNSATFTPTTDTRVWFRAEMTNTNTNTLMQPQLEKGSTATSYTPHQEQTQIVSLGDIELCKIGNYQDYFYKTSGKNLLELGNGTISNSGLTATITDKKTISMSGTSTAISFCTIISDRLNLEKGTYTLGAFNPIASSDNGMDLRITTTGGSGMLARLYLNVANNTLTFTLNENLVNGRLIVRTSSGVTLNNFIITPMLVKGSTIGNYEPYGSGIWYKKENVVKINCKNTDTWYKSGSTAVDKFYVRTPYSYYQPFIYDSVGNKCNYFTYKNGSNEVGKFNLGDNSGYLSIFFNYSTYGTTTLNDFKTWIGTIDLTCYLPLQVANDIQITNETLIEQLDNLQKMYSYNGTTNISSSGSLPMILNVSAIKGE